ncbi:MAG: toxin co-regulated pilus biosynthesis Q family protein [Acidithiobacillus sp.]
MLQIITHNSINPPAMVATVSGQPRGRVQFLPISPSAGQIPALQGFKSAFTIQPILAEHGTGTAALTSTHGEGTAAQAIQKILPYGWRVYTKPETNVFLGSPILYNGHGNSWIVALKSVLKQSGLHGAIWWGPRILTLWPAPALPTYQPTPHLLGYKQTHLRVTVDHPGTSTILQGTAHSLGATPLVPSSAEASLPTRAQPGDRAQPALLGLTPVFLLNQGDLILTDLQKWAKQSGWTVVWQVPEDWQVPNTTTFSGDFRKSVSQVIQALSANGANVHAVFHTANNTVVISGAGGGE